jgi:hypothetical protein
MVECSGPLQRYRDSQYAVVQEWRAPSIPHTSLVCGVVSLPWLVQDEIDVNPLFSSSRVLAVGRGADGFASLSWLALPGRWRRRGAMCLPTTARCTNQRKLTCAASHASSP